MKLLVASNQDKRILTPDLPKTGPNCISTSMVKPQRAAGTQGKLGRKETEKIPRQRRDHAEAAGGLGRPLTWPASPL